MNRKKGIAILLCCGLAAAGLGCGTNQETQESQNSTESSPAQAVEQGSSQTGEKPDPFGAYEEPITLTTIIHQTVTQAVPEGITLENNPWQELWKSKGINVEYQAVAADTEDLPNKINLAITGGEIPDFMDVGYATYQELQEAGLLADLTDVIDEYASEELKALMYADGGRMAENVTVDGRVYGITQPADYYDKGGVVAIRTDWLKELNLEESKSMSDVWDIAAAFKENNMGGTCTIGIGATKEVSDMLAMKYLIAAHGGSVSSWLEKDGELVYGLIQPETKEALSKLHDKYAEGLLDQEYGTKSEQQLFEDAVSGKSGVVVCNMTAPFFLDNGVSLGQEWGYFPLYDEDGGYAPVEVSTGIGSCTVVSKDCEHPEAVIKLFNMFVKYGTEEAETYASDGVNNLSYPAIMIEVNANHDIYEAYKSFLETGETPEKVPSSYQGTVDTCELWRLNGDTEGRTLYSIFGPGGTQEALAAEIEGGGYRISAFTGAPGEASVKYGGNLGTLADQMIANIITGARDISYFDEFVETWKSSGGDAVTAEVNEWYKDQQS